MKITAIKQQIKQTNRYSIFVEGKYAFSLSDSALLTSKLANGQELTTQQVREYKQLSNDDKLYNLTLRYIALRPRTEWEIKTYLKQKNASPSLSDTILNKLSKADLINDERFASMFISDRQLLRPTSRRKLILELRQKHVVNEIIEKAMEKLSQLDETESLRAIVRSKRRQTRYKDDLKLMQYLSRQGFNYGDIKEAIQADNIDS